MLRTVLLSLGISFALTANTYGQASAARFRWQVGQALTYQVEHNTSVSEVVGGSKVETASKLALVKRWSVIAVDAGGVATISMSLAALRHEQTRPNGEILLFDSAAPDKSTPELREQMKKFVGPPLAVLRIDTQGRVLEVKQGGAVSRYEVEPPFTLLLPGQPVTENQAWQREYLIPVEPPLGTGEKHPALQKYTCTKVAGNQATITLSTELKTPPATPLERLPLLQKLPQGEIVFDLDTGRVQSVRLGIEQTIQGHQGEGSSYRFQSSYREQYVQP